jgi:hypothetical protein
MAAYQIVRGELLYKLAKDIPSGQAIVEIVNWRGRSAVWLAKGTEAGQMNKVYSIHLQSENKVGISEGGGNTPLPFLSTLTKAGVQDTVVPLVITSDTAAKGWREKVGLLWIDLSCRHEDIEHEFLSWERHLFPGAIVALGKN